MNNAREIQAVHVITGGSRYVDIDVYASCIAYRELLNLLDVPAKAITSASLNESVSDLIKMIPLGFDSYTQTKEDKFIVLDVSNPDFFDEIVFHDKIIEIIDHHIGHEDYWHKRPEVKTQIEHIGSVATMIFEKFVSQHKKQYLSTNLCKLLVAAIIDNTLNLKAGITTDRDHLAFYELMQIGNLNDSWPKEYLESCESQILCNLKNAIQSDTKHIFIANVPNALGQLMVFNHEKVLAEQELIKQAFQNKDDWALNLISLRDGKSYLISDSILSRSKLELLFGKKFNGNILELDNFMLRKEIMALAYDYGKKDGLIRH